MALLRACQPDGRRTLVRQALDVLTPALVKRLPMTPEHKYPIWIRYTKRVGGALGCAQAQALCLEPLH